MNSFQLHAQTIHQAVGKGIIACDLVDVEDGSITKTGLAQGDDIGFNHVPGLAGELDGVGEHGPVSRGEGIGRLPILLQLLHQCLVIGQAEQPGSMMGYSVVAAINGRYHHRNHLPLYPRQIRPAPH